MTMTREDAMRELELLPVWKLREPYARAPSIAQTDALQGKQEAPSSQIKTPIEQTEAITTEVATEAAKASYEITISSDKNWCFICAESLIDAASQSTLFNNILRALHIEKPIKIQAETLENIHAKVIIVMGEKAAQVLLESHETLETLRGKLHALNIVATYDLAHLLQNPADKAKTWEDLCLAKAAMESL